MIRFKQKGDFKNLSNFFERTKSIFKASELDKYGKEGVELLRNATPKDTGTTADSWYYEIYRGDGVVKISFFNSNIQNGIPIAILLQYGHATRNGSFVHGIDYINPSMRPLFRKIADNAWKDVTGK
jgi:hypothetical protein